MTIYINYTVIENIEYIGINLKRVMLDMMNTVLRKKKLKPSEMEEGSIL